MIDLPVLRPMPRKNRSALVYRGANAGGDTKEFELPRIDVVGTNEKEEIKKLPVQLP